MHFILSTLLFFCGLAAALSVLAVSLVLVVRSARSLFPLLYLALSLFYSASLVYALARQGPGVACAQASGGQLALYGALLVLHLLFLFDLLKRAKASFKSGKGASR